MPPPSLSPSTQWCVDPTCQILLPSLANSFSPLLSNGDAPAAMIAMVLLLLMPWRGDLLRWLPWRARCSRSCSPARPRAMAKRELRLSPSRRWQPCPVAACASPPAPAPAAPLALAPTSPAPKHGRVGAPTRPSPRRRQLTRRRSCSWLTCPAASYSGSRSRVRPPAMAARELRPGLSSTPAARPWPLAHRRRSRRSCLWARSPVAATRVRKSLACARPWSSRTYGLLQAFRTCAAIELPPARARRRGAARAMELGKLGKKLPICHGEDGEGWRKKMTSGVHTSVT
jgi:hypothetical protein